MVSPHRSHHSGPGLANTQFAALVDRAFAAVISQYHRVHAEERLARASRLYRMCPRQGGYQYAARLRLPPRIDYWAFTMSNFFVIPNPGLWVDGFADGAEDS